MRELVQKKSEEFAVADNIIIECVFCVLACVVYCVYVRVRIPERHNKQQNEM